MTKQIVKNLCSGVVLLSMITATSLSYAQAIAAKPPLSGGAIPVVDEKSEATQRSLMQNLKEFLALTELKRIETDNVLRLMLTPNVDQTMAMGTRIGAAEDSLQGWQETLLRDTANYDMNTPENKIDDYNLLNQRKTYCDDSFVCNLETNGDDLLASTLLGKPAFLDDAQANAAYQYIRNLTNFKPIGMLPDSEMYEDPDKKTELKDAGVKKLMTIYQQLPAMTLAQNSMLAMHADRQRFKDFGKGLPIGDKSKGSASFLEVMAYEVDRRYMSENWYKQMNQLSLEAMVRELTFMTAFQMHLDFKKYEQAQRMEALMAAQISLLSQMVSQMATATNDASAIESDLKNDLSF